VFVIVPPSGSLKLPACLDRRPKLLLEEAA
jgi:hypothetical protein